MHTLLLPSVASHLGQSEGDHLQKLGGAFRRVASDLVIHQTGNTECEFCPKVQSGVRQNETEDENLPSAWLRTAASA